MAGRPRTFDRDAALERALDAFWEHGYDGTSIAALTSALGIAAPSLYAAFGDKARLFDEAKALYLARLEQGLDAALAEPTARAAVERVLRDTAVAHTARACPRGCLVMSEPGLHAERAAARDAIRDRLRRARDLDGDLPPATDVEALADLIASVLTGMSAGARDGASRERLEAMVDAAMLAVPAGPS